MAEKVNLGEDEALCWNCGRVVVKTALTCPQCGQKWPGLTSRKVKFGGQVAIGVIILIAAIVFRCSVGEAVDTVFGFESLSTIIMVIGVVIGAFPIIFGILGLLGIVSTAGFRAREQQKATSTDTQKGK